ncbi:hypothetical protein ACFL2W_01065, partial [Candidatus Omnitrophota bacterium]
DANPSSINPGDSATLTWSSSDATAVDAQGGWSGSKSLSGSEVVTPASTTTYTLTATGPGGSVSQSVTVTVGTTPPTSFSVTAFPSAVAQGDPITVNWSAPAAQASFNDWIGMYKQGTSNTQYLAYKYTQGVTQGTTTFTAPNTDGVYEFRYLLKGSYTSVVASNPVTVGSVNPNPPPTLTLSANPSSIAVGDSSTLTWSSSDATAVDAQDGWSGSKSLSGSEVVTPAVTTTYTLTATGPGGSVSQSVTVTVGTTPPTSFSVTASPSGVAPGGNITVDWSAPAAQVSFNDWIGLYKQGDSDIQYLAYKYTAGATQGTASFTAPNTPGVYEFRYLLKGQYTSVAVSNPVTVQ